MRRFAPIIVCCLLSLLIRPSAAEAWWGWWDELSGPSNIRGITFDSRLWCGGAPPPPSDRLARAIQALARGTTLLRGIPASQPVTIEISQREAIGRELEQLRRFALIVEFAITAEKQGRRDELQAIAEAARVGRPPNRQPDAAAAEPQPRTIITPDVLRTEFRTEAETQPGKLQARIDALHPEDWCQDDRCRGSINRAIKETELARREAAAATVAFAGLAELPIGIRMSICPPDRDANRMWSIDGGLRFYHHEAEAPSLNEFAGGNAIRVRTVVPSFNYRWTKRLNWTDVSDAGIGAGYYRITSDQNLDGGITPQQGLLVEMRAEGHIPRALKSRGGWYRALWLIPDVRWTGNVFPSGFDANAFGPKLPPGPKANAIDGPDFVNEISLFVDLGSLFAR